MQCLSGLEIEKLLKDAGVPENIFQVAVGAKEVGELLLEFPLMDIFLPALIKPANTFMKKWRQRWFPVNVNLGGKDPLYVADDIADIKAVAAGTADGAFYNNGQSCCAVERIYVHEKIYDSYVDEFVKEVKSWKTGSPTEEGIYIGPLTRKDQLDVLEKQVSDAVQKGATIVTGGKRINGKGYFFEPTVLTNVTMI